MLNVGVIGYGYWGPNLVRNLFSLGTVNIKWLSDLDEKKLQKAKNLYPSLKITKNYKDIINDKEVDAIVIATPMHTHYEIGKECLEIDKHIFIEKPLTVKPEHAQELTELAEKKKKVLMTGHTFLYTGAVEKIKEIIDNGEIGDILFIHTSRLNLGLFQKYNNVVWDLMPHDISMILYFTGNKLPKKIIASGDSHIKKDIEDTAFANLIFDSGINATINVSWLDPLKVRNFTIVGTKKMIVFDDTEPLEKVKIYDKGVEENFNSFGEFQMAYRYGDIHVPKISNVEAIKKEMEHFIDCIENDKKPTSDGDNGFKVVKILNMIEDQIKKSR